MPCYHPIKAWQGKEKHPSGKRKIVFKPENGIPGSRFAVPCGQCIGCRLEYSRQWALRCVHEASLHDHNCFLTLTYAPEHLPRDGGLDKRHFQLFVKRLRKRSRAKLRYFMCGEYGEFKRPHYHACLFGYQPPDAQLWKSTDTGDLYTSEFLSDVWGKGFVTIGALTFESAAYVARYCLKKIKGEAAKNEYERVDPETGEVFDIQPEYAGMSRRPGIAAEWYKKFQSDVYPSDFVISRGVKMKPPRFYDSLFPDIDQIKLKRRFHVEQKAADNTPRRLRDKEVVKRAQLKLCERNL